MHKTLTFIFLLFFAFSSISFSQNKLAKVDKELNELQKNKRFNGSVLLAKDGKIIWQKNFGYSDIEHKAAINDSTKFEIASITKTFTAILILQLAEQGKINPDASVSTYLPAFTRKDSGIITIRNLLSHTSGIQDFVGLNCDFFSWTEKEFMEGLQKTPINFKAGTQFQYASSTYILLRFIIEKITGQSFETNLREKILGPAKMNNTGVIYNQVILNNRAMGYKNVNGVIQNALPIANHEIFIGASSIYSTTKDLLRFDQALYTDKLLKEKEKALMYTIVQPPYGYGWFVSDDPTNGKIVSHGGDVFGFTSLLERRLKNKITIVILGNLEGIDREKIVNAFDEVIKCKLWAAANDTHSYAN
jgi:CubicO group peptidase (beta-lactamase class C family)